MPKLDLDLWMNRINKGIELQEEQAPIREAAIQLYTNTFFGGAYDQEREVEEVNFVYELLNLVISAYYSRNPYIFARSRVTKYSSFAKTMEQVLNYYVEELQVKDKAIKSLMDSILQPPGWLKIGYTAVFGEEIVRPSILDKITKGNDKTEEELGILDETVKDESLFIKYVNSWKVIWPDGYNDIRECPWICEIEDVTLEDFLRNPMYKESVKSELKAGGGTTSGSDKPTILKFKSSPNLTAIGENRDYEQVKLTLYHVWNRRDRERFTVVKEKPDEVAFERDWNWYNEGFPYYDLSFNNVPATKDSANSYPMSDIQPIMPQLRQLTEFSSSIVRMSKRQGALLLYQKGSQEAEAIENMQRSNDLDAVEVDSLSDTSLQYHTTPPLPSDWFRVHDMILESLFRITGFKQLLQSQKGVDTATESENLAAGERLTVSRRKDVVEDHIKKTMRGFAALAWQFLSQEDVAEIIGEPVNDEMWPPLPDDETESRKIVQRELRYEIEAGSMQPPKDKAIERKQLVDAVGAVMAAFPGQFKKDKLALTVAKEFDRKDFEEAIISNDEEEARVAQQENELLAQEIQQLVSPNENHELHIKVHSQGQKTQAMDDHILQHAQYMQNEGLSPQQGDNSARVPSTSPELSRQGPVEFADIQGATNRAANQGAAVNP